MKKITCIILVLILITGTITGVVISSYGAKSVEANKLLLESILENRPWLINSLVEGDFSNNPYTQICSGATEDSFMDDVLANYEDNIAFKTLVDGMDLYQNSGQYVTNWTEEVIAALMDFLSISDALGVQTYMEDNIKSVDAIRYEDIINDVLTEDYTSSWGSTLFEADSDMEQYRQMSKILKNLSGYQKALKDNNDVLASGFFESSEDFMDYTDNFLDAYEDTLYDALVNIPKFSGLADHEALTKKVIGASALAFVLGAETYNPLKVDYSSSAYQGSVMAEKYSYYFADEIGMLLEGTGKVINFTSNATEYAMIANAVASQSTTTAAVLNRISNTTSSDDIKQTMKVYKKLVEDQGKADALAVDSVLDYLSRQDKVGKAVLKQGGKLFTNVVNLRHGYFDGSKMVMTNALCENLIKAGKCVAIAVWIADKATNIQETAKKIYLCKYTNKLIKEAVKTYRADRNAYNSSKTDENAKKVLDDLEFLKKLRLYGEKQGYEGICSQTESIVGLLLGGDGIHDHLEQRYQGNIDALLGCSIVPTTYNDLSINQGEELNVYPIPLDDGSWTLCAHLIKNSGDVIRFPEADIVLMNGLTINGGTLKLLNSQSNPAEVFINQLNVNNTSVLSLKGSKLTVGEINNSDNLTIEYLDESTEATIISTFNNTGTSSLNLQGKSLKVQDLSNSDTISIASGQLDIYGNISSTSGNYTGNVNICGDGSVAYENSYQPITEQNIKGSADFEKLTISNTTNAGVRVEGMQNVSSYYSDLQSKIKKAENIYVTGSCQINSNRVKNSLSFKNYTSADSLEVGGIGKIYNYVSFNQPVTFKDGLMLTNECEALELNGETVVKGDINYAAGTITGSEWLKLYGDVDITADNPSITKLDFAGLTAQKFYSSNDLTVEELNNHNLSLSGVDVSSRIIVTSILHSGSTSRYRNGKNLVLTNDAHLNGNKINGSISANNWNCENSCVINGDLYASGEIHILDNVEIEVNNYNQQSGMLIIGTNGKLYCKNNFLQKGTTENAGSIFVDDDSSISGKMNGGAFKTKGDISASATLDIDSLIFESKVPQTFSNSSSSTVINLTVNNTSKSGLDVSSVINVTGEFTNNSKELVNGSNIVLSSTAVYNDSDTNKGDFSISGNYVLEAGKTLTVNGKLTLQTGATLQIKTGARLFVKRGIASTSSTISVEEGAVLKTDDYLLSSNDDFDICGEVVINGDAYFRSSNVQANGLLKLNGDLDVSSGMWDKPNICFAAKVPQVVSGNAIDVNNIEIKNTSKTGITFNSSISYYGTINTNSSIITGENKLVDKG